MNHKSIVNCSITKLYYKTTKEIQPLAIIGKIYCYSVLSYSNLQADQIVRNTTSHVNKAYII